MSDITVEVGCRVILMELANSPSRPSRILDVVKEKGDLQKAQLGLDTPLGKAVHKMQEGAEFSFSCDGRLRRFKVTKIINPGSHAPAVGGPRNRRVTRKEALASYRDVLA